MVRGAEGRGHDTPLGKDAACQNNFPSGSLNEYDKVCNPNNNHSQKEFLGFAIKEGRFLNTNPKFSNFPY